MTMAANAYKTQTGTPDKAIVELLITGFSIQLYIYIYTHTLTDLKSSSSWVSKFIYYQNNVILTMLAYIYIYIYEKRCQPLLTFQTRDPSHQITTIIYEKKS
jgi:hypothetical protein